MLSICYNWNVEVETYTRSRIHNPSEILSPLVPDLPEAVKKTVNHEIAHANADPEKNYKGGEFGYSAVVFKISDTVIMASWVAWYQPWGERKPEDRMEMAKAPGWSEMSEQDLLVYQKAKSEWFIRLTEKQNDVSEENPISVLEIIPSKEDENEDEYDLRKRFIFEFAKKLDKAIADGILPPEEELIGLEFSQIHEKYQEEFIKAYNEVKKEIEKSTVEAVQEITSKIDNIEEDELEIDADADNKDKSTGGTIYIAPLSPDEYVPNHTKLPLAA